MATSDNREETLKSSILECNICLELSSQSVVSYCGHVFCWPCIYRWLETQTLDMHENTCPVCKAVLTKDKLIPIYGRDSDNVADPRLTCPPRPAGQYSEHQPQFHQASFNFPEITNSNAMLASASINFGGFGFRASLGPTQTTIVSTPWNIMSSSSAGGSGSELEDIVSHNVGQMFINELTKNLFFTVSLLSFLYMLII